MSGAAAYAAVGLGSALGSTLRYLVSAGSLAALGPYFPWGTLLVNVLGAWLIGWLATRHARGFMTRWQPFLVTGFCGGFTTFSMFSLEVVHLASAGRAWLAVLYVLVSLPLWLGAALHGKRVAAGEIALCDGGDKA